MPGGDTGACGCPQWRRREYGMVFSGLWWYYAMECLCLWRGVLQVEVCVMVYNVLKGGGESMGVGIYLMMCVQVEECLP